MAIQVVREVAADVVKRGATRAVYAKQHDVNSRFLNIRIQEDGKNIVVDPNLTVLLNVERSDKAEKMFYGSVNPNGTVKVPLTSWMLELEGTLVCDVSIVSEDPTAGKLTTMQFNIFVEAAVITDSAVEETEEYSVIVDLLTRTTAAERQAASAAESAELVKATCEDATKRANESAENADARVAGLYDETVKIITEELAKRGQLKPEFANSISECTDNTKLYVLPDGYIYGYSKTTTTRPVYTNVFDKDQALKGYRLGSGGAVSAQDDTFVTNYIPVSPNTQYAVRMLGASNFWDGNDRISEYSAANESSHVLQTRGYDLTTTTESNGALVFTFTTQATTKYLRFGIQYDIANFDTYIITLNQPIEVEIIDSYAWANTGHAFVPADYEDRILALEIKTASIGNTDGVPSFIDDEAKRVATLVAGQKTLGSFSFIAATDTHHATGGVNTDISVIHAGMGAEYVRRYTQIDMLAMLGDYIGGADGDVKTGAVDEYLAVHKAMYSAGNGIKQIWLRGNHDRLLQSGGTTATDEEFTLDEMYAHIGSMNSDTVSPDGSGSYGYMDFEHKKIRVVYFNTSDDDGTYVWCTPAQVQWIADNALNLSGKANPSEWGIVVLSHIPIWGGVFDYMTSIQTMLDAYNEGESGSIVIGSTTINYNFATHGEIICLVNGHTHNCVEAITPKGIPCFSVPQVCSIRANEYATGSSTYRAWGEFDDSGKPVYHAKTINTDKGTSFNVFTIDRKNRVIYAHCYGAGIDRSASY